MATAMDEDSEEVEVDDDDMLTCTVCLTLFDEGIHKPKFLTCHHTFCVECLKSINSVGSYISCPLCRQRTRISTDGIDGLPSNPYIIKMIKSSSAAEWFKKRPWCLKCNEASYCSSPSTHPIIYIGTTPPESVAKLMEQKNVVEMQMATMVEGRRGAKTYLGRLLAGVRTIQHGFKRLEKDNDEHLAKMTSMLERTKIVGPNETYQSVSRRVKQATEFLEKEAPDFEEIEDIFLKHKDTRISVQFKDAHGECLPTLPIFEEGFTRRELQDYRDSSLQAPLEVATQVLLTVVNESPEEFTPQQSPQPTVTTAPPTLKNPFSIHSWFLAMDVRLYGQLVGTVVIRPDPSFCNFLMMELVKFCFTPSTFVVKIDKAHPASSVTLELNTADANFTPTIPNPGRLLMDGFCFGAKDALDVGFSSFGCYCKEDGADVLINFQLLMLLEPFDGTRMKPSVLFGRIIQGEEVIAVLSRVLKRDECTVTIDSRMYSD